MTDFFSELEELQRTVPRIGSIRLQRINSEYTHNIDQCKNCYLIMNAVQNEDCMYGRDFYENNDCVDCDHILRCNLCYQCLNCRDCWNCIYLQDSNNCRDCDYGYDLKDCKNCIGCCGLRKKEFHIFNQPYSQEDFAKQKEQLTDEKIKFEFKTLKQKVPRISDIQIGTEHCLGSTLYHCQNGYDIYDCVECQDVGYSAECKDMKDSWDIFVLEHGELCYECSSNHILHNSNFCFMCTSSSNLEYCELIFNCKDCFGCIGLNHKQYHILNKPYSAEEYAVKVSEIKAQLKKEGLYAKRFLPSTYALEDTVVVWDKL